MKDSQLASVIEEKRTAEGKYPPYWPIMSKQVKALAEWCCERCGVRNNEDAPDGTMLTVHHLDGNKWNCEWWNLAALCQQCHLRIQARVDFLRPYYRWNWETMEPEAVHSAWMARHIKGYNAWLLTLAYPDARGFNLLPLDRTEERDYSKEWPEREAMEFLEKYGKKVPRGKNGGKKK
jgi:hypothetical protein